MSEAQFFDFAVMTAFGLTLTAFLLTLVRLGRGPTLADRVLSLDMLVTLAIGLMTSTNQCYWHSMHMMFTQTSFGKDMQKETTLICGCYDNVRNDKI